MNNSSILVKDNGRFGNHFIRTMVASILARKYNLKIGFESNNFLNIYDKLSIPIYSGEKILSGNDSQIVNNYNFMNFILNDIEVNKKIILNDFYQTSEFSNYLRNYFNIHYRESFNNNNPYKDVDNSENVFIHVRLGDVYWLNPGYDYYSSILNKLKFNKGYISSDSPDNPIVQNLIKNYNLTLYNDKLENTLLFGSTCKYIILSEGTFSWLIGFLSNNSIVYYPKTKIDWHGDIFYQDWNKVIVNREIIRPKGC